jgi:CDGSH-type Zn-finger protein
MKSIRPFRNIDWSERRSSFQLRSACVWTCYREAVRRGRRAPPRASFTRGGVEGPNDLHLEIKSAGGSMAQIKIIARKNGPFRVEAPEGSVELVDADGRQYDLTGKPNFALCRCGGSVNKPFCDGTHSRVGFQAAEAAVRAEDKAKE